MEQDTPSATSSARGKLVILALVCLFYIGSFSAVLNKYPELRIRSDFFVRWHAMTKLRQEGRNLYDPQNGDEVDQILYGEDNEEFNLDFYYPAHLLVIIGPLAWLSYPAAHLIWTIEGQVFLGGGIAAAMWAWRWPNTVNQVTVWILATLVCLPTFQHTFWGQFNTIGVLSLGMCLLALHKRQYGLAGLWAIGLTVKPHPYLLVILFLGVWVLARRERWPFVGGVVIGGFLMWLAAEWVQPAWVFDFLASIGRYPAQLSVMDMFWNPYQAVSGLLVVGTVAVFVYHRQAEVGSLAFAGCLALSLAVWFWVMPMILMFHVLALPVGMIGLLAGYEKEWLVWYRPFLFLFAFVYAAGWVGFVIGPFVGEPIWLAEIAYKIVLPLVVGAAGCVALFKKDLKSL